VYDRPVFAPGAVEYDLLVKRGDQTWL